MKKEKIVWIMFVMILFYVSFMMGMQLGIEGETTIMSGSIMSGHMDEIRITGVAKSEEYIESAWNNTTMPEDYPDIWSSDYVFIYRPKNGTTPKR